jgi:hypothetical protein
MIYGYLENGEPKKIDQNKRDKLISEGKFKSMDFTSFDSDKAYNDWAKIKKSDKAFNDEMNKNFKFRNENGKVIASYKGQDIYAYGSEQEAKKALRGLWDSQEGNSWKFNTLVDKQAKDYKDKVTKEANSKPKKRYLVASGKFKESGYDDGTRYTSVSDTPPTDGKSYIEFTGTLDEANAEIKRLNERLNAGDKAQQEATSSPAGTAKDDQLENQTAQNTAAAVMNGQNSADADKSGAKATVDQKKKESEVNPGYVKGENEATPPEEKKKIEDTAGERLPGDTLDDGSQQKIKDQEVPLPGNVNLPSGKRNKPEEKKEEQTTTTVTPPAATNTTTEDPSKLLNDYKLGKLNAYPTLKAVVDMISKNAKMNMDRAGLLTGGQRYEDAYDAIETETDKMMDANRELRSEEAIFEDALKEFDNGNKAPLQALLMSNKTTIEQIADAKGITVEEAKEQYGFNKAQRKAQAEQAVLKTEADKQEILAKIDERIAGLQNTKAQISEARRQLAGRAWDAYHDTMAAVQDGLKGIFVTGASSTAGRTEGAAGTIQAGFESPIITAGGSTTGSSQTTSQNSSTQSIDQLLYKSLEDTQNIATAQMEEQEAANDAHIETLDRIESWVDNAISSLEQQRQRIESTTVNMGTGQPQQTVAPAPKPTNLNYTVQPKGGEAQQ